MLSTLTPCRLLRLPEISWSEPCGLGRADCCAAAPGTCGANTASQSRYRRQTGRRLGKYHAPFFAGTRLLLTWMAATLAIVALRCSRSASAQAVTPKHL